MNAISNSRSNIGFHVLAVTANGLPFDADGDGLPDAFENWHGTGHQETGESDWQNANTQTNGLNDLQVWELSSNVQVNDPWQDYGSVTNTQMEPSLVAFGNDIVCAWLDSNLGVTGYGDSDHYESCAWFPPSNSVPQFVGWAVSHDGGVTFADKSAPPMLTNTAANEIKGNAGNVVLGWDTNLGTVYMVATSQRPSTYYPDGTNNPARFFLPFWRSLDKGETFLPPINVFPTLAPGAGEIIDKPAMVVDNFPGEGQGDVYVAIIWNSANKLLVSRSEIGGTNWTITNVVNVLARSAAPQRASLALLTNHTVCLTWMETTNVYFASSMNRGTNFTTSTNAIFGFFQTASNFQLQRGTNSANNDVFYAPIFPTLAANPTKNNLFLIYQDQATNTSGPPQAYFVQSTNGGANWDPRITINSDTGSNDHWYPSITVKPDKTKIFIAWYDRRNDPTSNSLAQIYGTFSALPFTSNSFASNFLISTAQFPPIFSGTNTNAWTFDPVYPPFYLPSDSNNYCGSFNGIYSHHIGDYNAAVSDNNYSYFAWADGRNTATNHSIIRNQSDIRYIRVSWPR